MLSKTIPLDECKDRMVYEIHSRNLAVGVFVQDRRGFIGIREKFGSRYLFMEFHYDTGAPFGTVRPIKELTVVPENIPLREHSSVENKIVGNDELFEFLDKLEKTIMARCQHCKCLYVPSRLNQHGYCKTCAYRSSGQDPSEVAQ